MMSKVTIALFIGLMVASSVQSLTYRVIETSDPAQNSILDKFNDIVLVTKVEGDRFALSGTCNGCTISEGGECMCTKRACFRETLSEDFICSVVGSKTSFNKLLHFGGKAVIAWNNHFVPSEVPRLKYQFKSEWIRFQVVPDPVEVPIDTQLGEPNPSN